MYTNRLQLDTPNKPQATLTDNGIGLDISIWRETFDDSFQMAVTGCTLQMIRDYLGHIFLKDRSKSEGIIERAMWFHIRGCNVELTAINQNDWFLIRQLGKLAQYFMNLSFEYKKKKFARENAYKK